MSHHPQNHILSVKLKKNTQTLERENRGSNLILKTTDPKPTSQGIIKTNQTALLITKHWVVYEWLDPNIKKVLFLPTDAYESMKKQKPESLSNYIEIHDFQDLTSGLVEWKAEQLHKIYNFTHVVVLAEEDLIRGARIRESLGIKHGQDVENALHYRDKLLMKSILKENNILVPECASVESASDVINFVKKHGIEVVVKPRKGYSSVNTWIIKDEKELESFLNSGFNKTNGFDSALDLEIEKYIKGEMYHIDGLVYDGEVKLAWPSKYVNICAEFQNSKFLASYTLSISNPLVKRLQNVLISTIKALGGPSCFPFHAEYFLTPEDDIVLCEIASRTGGAWVRHIIWRLFEIMQDKTFTQWQVQQEISHPELGDNWEERLPITTELCGWIFIYPKIGKIQKIPSECPLPFVAFSETFGSVGEIFSSRVNCVDSVFSAVFVGKTEEEMQKHAHELYQWFETETVYVDCK